MCFQTINLNASILTEPDMVCFWFVCCFELAFNTSKNSGSKEENIRRNKKIPALACFPASNFLLAWKIATD